MRPSRFHAPPPAGSPAEHIVNGTSPSRPTFLNEPFAKNPIDCPSGDQNGSEPPSVPGIAAACNASNERSQSIRLPPGPIAENATWLPPGEIAGPPIYAARSGATTVNLKTGDDMRLSRSTTAATATAASATSAHVAATKRRLSGPTAKRDD